MSHLHHASDARDRGSDFAHPWYNGEADGDRAPTRQPPRNIEAEEGVLGSVLLDNEVLARVRPLLAPTDFFRDAHEVVYRAMLGMADEGLAIDCVTLADRLERGGGFERIGGDRLLEAIANSVNHAANGEYHAKIVAEKARSRDLIETFEISLKAAYSAQKTSDELRETAVAALSEIKAHGTAREVPAPFTLGLVDSRQFFGEVYRLEWDVEGVIVKGEPAILGGPSKSLKTTLLVDAAVSLGTKTPFLGQFSVPRKIRTAVISGESGRRAIQASARQVCRSRGLSTDDIDGVYWGFALPQLTNREHLAALRKTIADNGLEFLAIDPFYLTILAGNAGLDVKSMFEMGPLLNDVAALCRDAGCTLLIVHHFTKRREDPFSPPELADLAYAGIGQFARQWMLVAPRERFDPEIGLFKLHFSYGGSAGHSGELALDIEVGKLGADWDDRDWNVTVANPSEARAARTEQRQAEADVKAAERRRARDAEATRDLEDAIVQTTRALRAEPNRAATARRVRDLLAWSGDRAARVLAAMESRDLVKATSVTVPMRGNRTQSYPGYQLADAPEATV